MKTQAPTQARCNCGNQFAFFHVSLNLIKYLFSSSATKRNLSLSTLINGCSLIFPLNDLCILPPSSVLSLSTRTVYKVTISSSSLCFYFLFFLFFRIGSCFHFGHFRAKIMFFFCKTHILNDCYVSQLENKRQLD